ncbi:MAG: UAA transporter [Candelina mexicana]|nr:MAG: UAA transporter [Candelina mexicana]
MPGNPTDVKVLEQVKDILSVVIVCNGMSFPTVDPHASIPGCPTPHNTRLNNPTEAVFPQDCLKDVKDSVSTNEPRMGIWVSNGSPKSSTFECPPPYNTISSTPTDTVFPNGPQNSHFTMYLREFPTLDDESQASILHCPTLCNTMTKAPARAEIPMDVDGAKFNPSSTGDLEVRPAVPTNTRNFISNESSVSRPFDFRRYFNSCSDPGLIHASQQAIATAVLSNSRILKASWTPPPLLSARSSSPVVHDKKIESPGTKPHGMDDGSNIISAHTRYKSLALYFLFNICLTLFNKTLMVAFPYPYLLTSLHAAFGCLGSFLLLTRRYFRLSQLSIKSKLALYAFSALYTFNIAVSNISLRTVTIPFHQVVRATTPAFTITIYGLLYRKSYSAATYATLVPIIAGVGFTTYGDYSYTMTGLIMTLLGAFLASAKTIATNRLQTGGVQLSAMELLYRMSPLALLQSLIYAHISGEGATFYEDVVAPGRMTAWVAVVLTLNGLMAFGLNVVSFAANKKVGALTMTVAGNVKQTFTVMMGVALFDVVVGPVNAFGIVLTLLGGALYAWVEVRGRGSVAALAPLQGVMVEKG